MGLCIFTFTFISSLLCLYTFWHGIPTSFYISLLSLIILIVAIVSSDQNLGDNYTIVLWKKRPTSKEHPPPEEHPPPTLAQFPVQGRSILQWAPTSWMGAHWSKLLVWKRCTDRALYSYIYPTLFAYFLVCHLYTFLHFNILFACRFRNLTMNSSKTNSSLDEI